METLLLELRYGFRLLRKTPGFSGIAVLTLALGIGASTAIFSVVDAVLLRPLPYPEPDKIVSVWEQSPKNHRMNLTDPNFDDFHSQNQTLEGLVEYNFQTIPVTGGSEPVRAMASEVSRDFFTVLGVQPVRGRGFAPDELRLNGARAVIVSYPFWQRYLGGHSDLSNFHLAFNGSVYSVIGVMPSRFDFPHDASLWIAREVDPAPPSRTAHNWNCVGRLRQGETIAQARADLGMIAHRIKSEYGSKADITDATVIPLADAMVGDVRTALLVLFAAVILLFLVASANVAGLLLARTSARRKELAVRAALGAGRKRLILQLLAESLPLSFTGGVLGIVLAAWATKLLPAILPESLPRREGVAINAAVLLFTLAATLVVALALGVFTAWRAGRTDLSESLSAGSRSYTGGSHRDRGVLVIAEVAATVVMLAGAGLLGRSFLKLVSVSPGFSGRDLIVARLWLSQPEASMDFAPLSHEDIDRQVRLLDNALTSVRSIPGVQSAAIAGALPVADADGFPEGNFLILNGQAPPTSFEDWDRFSIDSKQVGHADYSAASSDYFQTLGIPLIRGRLFNAQDGPESPHVAVISETLARQQWSGEDPIGQVIDFGNMDGNLRPLTIVGVVGDVRAEGLDQPASSIVYVDFRQRGLRNMSPTIVLRTSLPASAIVPTIRGIVRGLDPNIPIEFSTFDQALGGWLAERRFLLLLAGVFAGAALALAAVGIYGLIAHSVTRRTQEIGIRVALGAERGDVLRLIVGEGARLAVIGLVIGTAISLAVTRVISSQLFDVKSTDPLTFIAVAGLLSVVALLASYIPARRAIRLDPNSALRND